MIALKTSFSRRELLWFGPLFGPFGALIGALAMFRFDAPDVAKGIWIATAVVIALYYLLPPARRWIFAAWMAAVFPLGWLLTHLLLGAVFYLVVFPIGMLMRLFRYDALHRRFDREGETYWIKRRTGNDPRRYFRQF